VAGDDGRDHLRQLGGDVLTVAVTPDRKLVAVLPGVAETGLHRAADTEVERQLEHLGPCGTCDLAGAVDRPVGDDDDVEPGIVLLQLGDDARDVALLVVRRHDRNTAPSVSRHALPREAR
jgi:hypothetical protein